MSLSLSISFSLPPIGRWRTSRRSWRRRWTLLGSWTHRAPSWTWIAPTSKTTFPPDPPSTSLTASSACNFPSFLILSPFSLDWSFSTRFGRWWNRLELWGVFRYLSEYIVISNPGESFNCWILCWSRFLSAVTCLIYCRLSPWLLAPLLM